MGCSRSLSTWTPRRHRAQAVDQPRTIPTLGFASEAQAFFDHWFGRLETRVRYSRESACLIGHLAKYRSLMPSLALLFHLLDVMDGTSRGPVALDSARRAAGWCGYLEEHARRIYQAAFDSDPEPAQRLAKRLPDRLPNPFTSRDVQRKGWKLLLTHDEIHRALGLLEEHGWVYTDEVPSNALGGRPTTYYHKNARLLKKDSA